MRNIIFHKDRACARLPDAVAHAQGQLTSVEAADFERHAASCPACREEMRSTGALLARLKEWPDREAARDLVEPVLEQVRASGGPSKRSRWREAAAVAAILTLVAGAWLWSRVDPRRAAIGQATQWLVTAQRADGSWRAGGTANEPYDPALTGLGLLAGLDLAKGPAIGHACEKAAGWLVRGQDSEGRFGSPFSGTPYNQGIATLALLRWCDAHPGEPWRVAAERAVRHIVHSQGGSGGWGYAEGDPTPNVSITIWQLQALQKASELGMAEAAPALSRGLRWLRTNRNGEGLYGYRRPDDYPAGPGALTAMSVFCELACDGKAAQRPDMIQSVREVLREAASGNSPKSYYAAFFITQVLQRTGGERTEALLGQVQQTLLARQVRDGSDRGSWDLRDTYSDVGGKVYTTTMAVLALKD
jgi:hypothetical protein